MGHSDSGHGGAVLGVLCTESLDLVDGGEMRYKKGRWECAYCKVRFDDRVELILHEEQSHAVELLDKESE